MPSISSLKHGAVWDVKLIYSNSQRYTPITRYTNASLYNIIILFDRELNNWGWEIRKGDQEKNNDSTDHIHQHENSTILSRHKPEYQIKSNKMLCLADTILWSRDTDNYKISVVQTWCLWDVGISRSIENIMDGKDYQRGSIEKDGNRPRNSETIQDEEITITRTSQLQLNKER